MRSTDVGMIGQSVKYTVAAVTDPDGTRVIEVRLRQPPKLHCVTLLSMADDDIFEKDQELPPGAVSFFMHMPRARLYINQKGEKRATMFHARDLELWDGPVSSIAEFRKHIIAHLCDDLETEDVPFNHMLAVRDCITHLVGEDIDFCGCGEPLSVTHDADPKSSFAQIELQLLSRCKSCWAILCSKCGTESQYCDGCFNILQESSTDIGDEDDEAFV